MPSRGYYVAHAVSPKVIASTLASIIVPALFAVGTYVLANQDVLGISNPVLGVLVVSLITGAVTFLSGYIKTDPLRNIGAARHAAEPGRGRDPKTGRFL